MDTSPFSNRFLKLNPLYPNAGPWPQPKKHESRISNIEQGLPAFGGARGDQGISNHEVTA
jgi:hypothetical protein